MVLRKGGNFLNLLEKEGSTQKGGRGRGGVPTLEETMPHEYGLTKNQLHSSRTPDGINLSPIRPAIPHAPGQYVIRACTLSSSYYKKRYIKRFF